MPKITPFLWFKDNVEEAVNFYTSVFQNSKIISMSRFPDTGSDRDGKVMSAEFELNGLKLMAFDGGDSQFSFTEAISLFISCETQEEVDELWNKLSEGGQEIQCGWLKDKFGLFWQVIPNALGEMLNDKDPEKSKRVLEAMLKMKKIEIKELKEAYDGK